MKRLLQIALLTALAGSAFSQSFMNITAANIYGAGGVLLPSGILVWQATDSGGNPVSYQVNGGGQQITYPTVCPIVNGAITGGCQVANTSTTNPMNICFALTIKDSNNVVISPAANGNACVQPQTSNYWCANGACNFDQYVPTNPSVITAKLATPQLYSLGGIYQSNCPALTPVVTGWLSTGYPNCAPFPAPPPPAPTFFLLGQTGTAATACDNHVASGVGQLQQYGSSPEAAYQVTFSNGAAYCDANYAVEVTRKSAAAGFGNGFLNVVNQTAFGFLIVSSDTTEVTSTIFWTAAGYQ